MVVPYLNQAVQVHFRFLMTSPPSTAVRGLQPMLLQQL